MELHKSYKTEHSVDRFGLPVHVQFIDDHLNKHIYILVYRYVTLTTIHLYLEPFLCFEQPREPLRRRVILLSLGDHHILEIY